MKNWKKRFNEITKNTDYNEYQSTDRFCCGGDYCQIGHNMWIKSFVDEACLEEQKNLIEGLIYQFKKCKTAEECIVSASNTAYQLGIPLE